MKKVSEIMSVLKHSFSPDEPASQGIKVVLGGDANRCVIIHDANLTPIGIITEKDYFTKVIVKDKDLSSLTLNDIMNSPIITVSPDLSVIQAGKIMKEKRIKRLPVKEDSEIKGVVTSNMIAHAIVESLDMMSSLLRETSIDIDSYNEISHEYVNFEGYDSDLLGENLKIDDMYRIANNVSEIMSSEVLAVHQDESIITASKMMAEKAVSSIIVSDGESAVGLITERVVLNSIFIENKDPTSRCSDIMISPVVTIAPEATIIEASALMKEKGIGRLLVADGGNVKGIVTDTDILTAMFELAKDLHYRILGRWQDSDIRT